MSFVYIMQAVEPRQQRFLVFSLITGALVFLLWLVWFLFIPVTFYVFSDTAQIDDTGTLVATFADDVAVTRLAGESATFEIAIGVGQTRQFTARVMEVDPQSNQIYLMFNRIAVADRSLLPAATQGQVKIPIQRLTPLQITMQSIGVSA